MKPVTNKFVNKELRPPENSHYLIDESDAVNDIVSLPVWTDGYMCVSEWSPTFRERLSILFFGKVWLAIIGNTQPPTTISGTRNFLVDKNDD